MEMLDLLEEKSLLILMVGLHRMAAVRFPVKIQQKLIGQQLMQRDI